MSAQATTIPQSTLAKNHFTRRGMTCPTCRSQRTATIDCRQSRDGHSIRRRRICINGHRFTTYEFTDEIPEWSNWQI